MTQFSHQNDSRGLAGAGLSIQPRRLCARPSFALTWRGEISANAAAIAVAAAVSILCLSAYNACSPLRFLFRYRFYSSISFEGFFAILWWMKATDRCSVKMMFASWNYEYPIRCIEDCCKKNSFLFYQFEIENLFPATQSHMTSKCSENWSLRKLLVTII